MEQYSEDYPFTALSVEVAGRELLIPGRGILDVVEARPACRSGAHPDANGTTGAATVRGCRSLLYRGDLLHIVPLAASLTPDADGCHPSSCCAGGTRPMVVYRVGGRRIALCVDRVNERELVDFHTLPERLARSPLFLGVGACPGQRLKLIVSPWHLAWRQAQRDGDSFPDTLGDLDDPEVCSVVAETP